MRTSVIGGLLAVIGLLTICLAAPSVAATSHAPVLGKKGLVPYGIGWGTAHPKEIFNGGDPSGDVWSVRWSHWGAATATGHGLGNGFKPQGGYYARPVKTVFKASGLGRCTGHGPRAYRTLWFKQQVKPGSARYTKWYWWSGLRSICAWTF